MAQQTNEARLDAIREMIIHHPGCRPGRIARMLGLDNKTVQRALSQLEDRGDLLAEDNHGRLVWFGRRSGRRDAGKS